MNFNENDGMRYPSIDRLTQITHSKYKLIVAAAKRAKDLKYQKEYFKPLIKHPHRKKDIGIALEKKKKKKIVVVAKDENDE